MKNKPVPFLQGLVFGLVSALAVMMIVQWRGQGPRARLEALLGISGEPGWSGHARLGERTFPEGRLERIRFSRIGGETTAYLFLPTGLREGERRPAVIVLHGHNSSPEDAVGLSLNPLFGPIGRDLVKKGFVVLVPKARFEHVDMKEETRQAMGLLVRGHTLMGERARDVVGFAEFLRGHPAVDGENIGLLGWSMGATTGLFAAALDPGIKASYLSGGFGSVAVLIKGKFESPDNYVPGILPFGDLIGVAELICPRPLFVEALKGDTGLGAEEIGGFGPRLRRMYEGKSASARLRVVVYGGSHRLVANEAPGWLGEHLGLGTDAFRE